MFPHDYAFDPTGGYGLPELLALPPPEPPDGFAAFWRARRARLAGLDPAPRLAPSGQELPGWRVQELSFRSSDDITIHGWLLMPVSGLVRRGLVVGHGYGGRDAPVPRVPLSDCAVLFPCFRGLGRSPVPGLSANPLFHVLNGIEDRSRYVIGGCVDDLWLAVSALLGLFPQVEGHVGYMGTSFGGGIGALAAPWDTRIRRLHLEVPTFGHQALRLQLPCVGSGEALRIRQRLRAFDVMDTLAWFDAASAARFLSIPTHVAAAVFDPAVPPAGQFAVANAVPKDLRRLFVLEAGHFDYPAQSAQAEALFVELEEFFLGL